MASRDLQRLKERRVKNPAANPIVGDALRLKARLEKEAKFKEVTRSDRDLREEACKKFGVGDTVQCGKYAGKITEIRKDFNVTVKTRLRPMQFSPSELVLIAKAK